MYSFCLARPSVRRAVIFLLCLITAISFIYISLTKLSSSLIAKRIPAEKRFPYNQLSNNSVLEPVELKILEQFKTLSQKAVISSFCNTLLVVAFNWPFYEAIPVLHEMYDNIFAKVITCGSKSDNVTKPDIELDVKGGYQSYHCAAVAMQKHRGFEGYFLVSDDMIVNWWNLQTFDKTKIWTNKPLFHPLKEAPFNDGWIHWNVEKCRKFNDHLEMLAKKSPLEKQYFKTLLTSCCEEKCCARGWSDTFFIPQKHAEDFIFLSNFTYKIGLFLETSVPLITSALDIVQNHINLKGHALLGWSSSMRETFFNNIYNVNSTYHHPFKIADDLKNGGKNVKLLRKYFMAYTKIITEKNTCSMIKEVKNTPASYSHEINEQHRYFVAAFLFICILAYVLAKREA